MDLATPWPSAFVFTLSEFVALHRLPFSTTIPSCIFTSIYSNSFRTAILIGVLLHIITSWCAFKCLWLRNTIWTRGVSLVKKHRPTRVGVIFFNPLLASWWFCSQELLLPRYHNFRSQEIFEWGSRPRKKNTKKQTTKQHNQKQHQNKHPKEDIFFGCCLGESRGAPCQREQSENNSNWGHHITTTANKLIKKYPGRFKGSKAEGQKDSVAVETQDEGKWPCGKYPGPDKPRKCLPRRSGEVFGCIPWTG